MNGGVTGTATADIQFAKPNSDGTIPASGAGSWTSATNSLPVADQRFGITVYGSYIYVTGSSYINTTVRYASLNSSDGSIGTWGTTSSFTTARIDNVSMAYNGYLFVLGGCNHYSVGGACDSNLAVVQ